jgi:hypothetical protein
MLEKRSPCIVVHKIPRPPFLKLWHIAIKSGDEPLNHLFIKFIVYSLSFSHKFPMNDTFRTKKNAVNIVPTAIFAFSLSELSVSLDSTKLHSDALFLDRTWNTLIHRPLQSFLKTFLSSSIISTNSTDDAARWCFWSGVNKWGTKRTFSFFQIIDCLFIDICHSA